VAEKNYEPLSLKLQKDTDKDIIEFLKDKPTSYIIRLALRRFMNDSRDVLSETPSGNSKPNNNAEDDNVLGW
jgi:hypothetical protein